MTDKSTNINWVNKITQNKSASLFGLAIAMLVLGGVLYSLGINNLAQIFTEAGFFVVFALAVWEAFANLKAESKQNSTNPS